MYISYLFISGILAVSSFFIYKNKINPISLFCFIFIFCVTIYNSHLIYYFPIENNTWLILIEVTVFYSLGNIMGFFIKKRSKKTVLNIQSQIYYKRYLKKIIIILCLLSGLTIIPKFIYIIKIYGRNIFYNIGNIYYDSIRNNIHFSSFFNTEGLIFVAIVFTGIYLYYFGFEKIVVFPPIFLSVISQLSTGSRGSLVATLVLFSSHLLLNKESNTILAKNKKIMRILIIMIILVFFAITFYRADKLYDVPYANDLLKKFTKKSKLLYSITFYFSSPIAVLNEYVKSPIYSEYVGGSTFRIFYILLDSMNLVKYNVNFVDEFLYFTPLPSNVMTFIGELIYDFGILGLPVCVFLLGFIFSYFFKKNKTSFSLLNCVIISTVFGLVSMSFFAWFLRLSIFWYVLILGGGLSYFIDLSVKNKVYHL